MASPPSGTITFLFTDIEGSSRLWDSRPTEMEAAVARHDGVVRTAIEGNDGYVFSTAGDSFGAAFSDPLDALTAALEAQLGLVEEHMPVDGLAVRMGIHTGVAHERDGDYFGAAVNRAARIADAGHGGQILVGHATCDLLTERLPVGVELRPLGEHRLKDLASPEAVHQVVREGLRSAFPPLRTLDDHINNLPVELSSFVGRAEEMAEVADRLASARLVTLTGVGGAGKTRLAVHAAAETYREFPDGVWFVELAPVADEGGVASRAVETLGLQPRSSPEVDDAARMSAEQALQDFLGDRTSLLILDNCEHVIDDAAVLAEALLLHCPRLRILATSREGLGVRGEQIIRVPSLGLTSAEGGDPGEARLPGAVELFADRAGAVSDFVLDDENAATVAEICRRLDGMPLAIELAAARTGFLSVDQIAARLTDAFRLLTGGARTRVPRQQTLEATIDWSYRLLDDQEQRVFDRLSVFRGGFTLESAEAIVSGEGVAEGDVLDVIGSLADKSMVQAKAGTGRFVLLETLRGFGVQKLAAEGEGVLDVWRERHAEHFAAVADAARPGTRSARQVEWFDRLDADHENFKTAFTWAMDQGSIETAARIADGLWWFWIARGHGATGIPYLRLLHQRDDLPPLLRIGLLTGLCYMEHEAGDVTVSLAPGEEAVTIARELDDPEALCAALIPWANTAAANFGMQDEAHVAYREGYELGRQVGDDWLMGWHALNEGWIYRYEGRLEDSDRLLALAADHLRRVGVAFGLGWALSGMAANRFLGGDLEGAVVLFEESGDLNAKSGNPGAETWALFGAARALSYLDRHEAALENAQSAMELLRRITRNFIWGVRLGEVHRRRGDPASALDALEEYVGAIEGDVATSPLAVGYLVQLGLLAAAVGRHDLAAALLAAGTDGASQVMAPSLSEQAEWAAAWEDITRHVPEVDAVRAEWSAKPAEEITALVMRSIPEIRHAIESADR